MASHAITLQEIWEGDVSEVLMAHGYSPSDNANYDRALVAQIYYNAGWLVGPDIDWVSHPRFLEMMKCEASPMEQLKKMFFRKLFFLLDVWEWTWDGAGLSGSTIETVFIIGNDHPEYQAIWGDIPDNTGWDAAVVLYSPRIYDVIRERIGNGRFPGWYNEYGGGGIGWQILRPVVAVAGNGAIQDAIRATAIAGVAPAAIPAIVATTIASAVWPAVLRLDAEMLAAAEAVQFTIDIESFSFTQLFDELLAIDVSNVYPMARCYYLYLLWDMVYETSPRHLDAVYDLITRMGCENIFAPEELNVGPHLLPVLGKIIEPYMGPPPRSIIIQRLLALA